MRTGRRWPRKPDHPNRLAGRRIPEPAARPRVMAGPSSGGRRRPEQPERLHSHHRARHRRRLCRDLSRPGDRLVSPRPGRIGAVIGALVMFVWHRLVVTRTTDDPGGERPALAVGWAKSRDQTRCVGKGARAIPGRIWGQVLPRRNSRIARLCPPHVAGKTGSLERVWRPTASNFIHRCAKDTAKAASIG